MKSKCCNYEYLAVYSNTGETEYVCYACDHVCDITNPTPPTSTVEEIIKDGIANHTGEFANPWLFKHNFTHEELSAILDGVAGSKRLSKAITHLIQQAYNDGYRKAKEDNEVC